MSKLLIIELLQSEDIAAPPSSVEKVMGIDEHIGCAMSGLIADARTLVLTTILGELALPHKEVLKSLAIYQILVLLVSQTSIRLFPCGWMLPANKAAQCT